MSQHEESDKDGIYTFRDGNGWNLSKKICS